MVFAWNTQIESPGGPRPIQDYAVGDWVMTASAAGTGGWAWAPASVVFSAGTGPGGQHPAMVYLHFGETGGLVVTADQLLMLAGGRLLRADLLVPGSDSLAGAKGGTFPIEMVSVGMYVGGVHDIATAGMQWNGSLDGHLLNCMGVIGGDFVLQVSQSDPRMAPYLADARDRAAIGTAQRSNMHSGPHPPP
jgi:hypothetical protein